MFRVRQSLAISYNNFLSYLGVKYENENYQHQILIRPNTYQKPLYSLRNLTHCIDALFGAALLFETPSLYPALRMTKGGLRRMVC